MSGKSSSPSAYNDVKYVLDMALEKPGLIYECNTPGAATNFKQRCHRYRNILREMEAERLAGVPGVRPELAYDVLVIRQQNEAGDPDRRGRRLVFDHQELGGKLLDPDTGKELHMPEMPSIIRDN